MHEIDINRYYTDIVIQNSTYYMNFVDSHTGFAYQETF